MSMAMTPAMSLADLPAIAPLIILTVTALLLMMQAAFRRHHPTAVVLAVLGLLAAFAWLPTGEANDVTPLLRIDAYVVYCWLLFLLVAMAVCVLAWRYWQNSQSAMEEFYILLLCASLGACVLVASRHFAALFIGLELMTVALIAMLGYPVSNQATAAERPLEAALKYLVLSAISSAILLFGMALLYAETGSLDFAGIARTLSAQPQTLYILLGLGMFVTGLGFKLSLVPFHLWTPDVYQGAPTPVTAFIATLSKGAVLALLLRYVLIADVQSQPLLLAAVAVIAVLSMLIGNLLALLQDNPKRLLAFSSIAHMGYALLAPLVAGPYAMEAVGFYLAAYLLMTLGAFAVLGYLGEPQRLEELRGLLWQRPAIGLTMMLMMLSLAGIPLTAGFIGKFYLVGVAVQGALWMPLAALVIGSVIGLFYYLRVVVIMAQSPDMGGAQVRLGPADAVVLLSCALAVFILGIMPGWLLDVLRNIARLAT